MRVWCREWVLASRCLIAQGFDGEAWSFLWGSSPTCLVSFRVRSFLHHASMLLLVSVVPLSAWWILKRTMFVWGSGIISEAIWSLSSGVNIFLISASFSLLSSAVACALKPPRTRVSPCSPPSSCQSFLFRGSFCGLFGSFGVVCDSLFQLG